MRNGDAYKIQNLEQQGVPHKDIVERFSRWYSAEEIGKFFRNAPPETKPQPKKARRRSKAKE